MNVDGKFTALLEIMKKKKEVKKTICKYKREKKIIFYIL